MDTLLNGLWIIGLALLLAILSFTYWRSLEQHQSFSQSLKELFPWLVIIMALLLISLGLSLAALPWWQKGVGGVIFLWSLWQGWRLWQSQSDKIKLD